MCIIFLFRSLENLVKTSSWPPQLRNRRSPQRPTSPRWPTLWRPANWTPTPRSSSLTQRPSRSLHAAQVRQAPRDPTRLRLPVRISPPRASSPCPWSCLPTWSVASPPTSNTVRATASGKVTPQHTYYIQYLMMIIIIRGGPFVSFFFKMLLKLHRSIFFSDCCFIEESTPFHNLWKTIPFKWLPRLVLQCPCY